jgi:hypothetical protein
MHGRFITVWIHNALAKMAVRLDHALNGLKNIYNT